MPRVLGLVLKAWQFRVVSPRRCICKKIPWPNKISELDREIPSSSHRRGPWQKGKGHNSCTERKTGECFQRETIGSCSRRDDCSFLHTHATGRRETMWKKVGDAGKTHLEQASSSVPKVKEQTDVKSSNSLKARVKKKPVYGWQDEKNRRVIISIIPCVVIASRESDAFVAFVAKIDMLMVRSNLSARSRKEGTQGAVAIPREKRVQGCVSQNSDPRNSVLRKAGELGLNASAGHTMKFSGCTRYKLKFGKEKGQSRGINQKGESHERNPCAPSFEEQHLRKRHNKQIVTAK